MTAITPIEPVIRVALAQRGLAPSSFVCGCCNAQFDRNEHMNGFFTFEHMVAVAEEYGSNVCVHCADDFKPEETVDCEFCMSAVCYCDHAFEIWRDEQS